MDWIHFYHAALFTPIKIKMALAGVVLVVLGAGIILGSEIKLHTMTMTVLYAVAFFAVIGLGYFGSGIIYGRGLGIKPPKPATAAAISAPRAADSLADSGRIRKKADTMGNDLLPNPNKVR